MQNLKKKQKEEYNNSLENIKKQRDSYQRVKKISSEYIRLFESNLYDNRQIVYYDESVQKLRKLFNKLSYQEPKDNLRL